MDHAGRILPIDVVVAINATDNHEQKSPDPLLTRPGVAVSGCLSRPLLRYDKDRIPMTLAFPGLH
jgi:hypothetical protein